MLPARNTLLKFAVRAEPEIGAMARTISGWSAPQASGSRQSRHVSPRVASGRSGVRACCRRPAAIFVYPARRRALIARVRRQGRLVGPWPVRTWLWSSPKVTSRDPVQAGLDAPVPAHPAGQQLRGGLAGVEAGDGVEDLHAPASPPGAPAADDRECLGRTGEELAVPVAAAGWVDDPDGAGLDPAVADRAEPSWRHGVERRRARNLRQ